MKHQLAFLTTTAIDPNPLFTFNFTNNQKPTIHAIVNTVIIDTVSDSVYLV